MQELSPIEWAIRPLKKYAVFSGRAPRAEYWWYVLATFILLGAAALLEVALGLKRIFGFYGPLSLFVVVVTTVPTIAVQVRRLHDNASSGLWVLTIYVPQAILTAMDVWQLAYARLGFSHSTGFIVISIVLNLTRAIAGIVILIVTVQVGMEGPNRFGPDPYGPDELEEVFA